MFISKKDLGDLKSKAGGVAALQSQIARLTNELNAHKGQTGQNLKAINEQIDLEENELNNSTLHRFVRRFYMGDYSKLTVKSVLKSIESRLSEQEKLTRMILAHLGVEYAKTTEETATGKREKEVLRRAKKK